MFLIYIHCHCVFYLSLWPGLGHTLWLQLKLPFQDAVIKGYPHSNSPILSPIFKRFDLTTCWKYQHFVVSSMPKKWAFRHFVILLCFRFQSRYWGSFHNFRIRNVPYVCHMRRHVEPACMYVHTVLYWESVWLRSISQSGINRLGATTNVEFQGDYS